MMAITSRRPPMNRIAIEVGCGPDGEWCSYDGEACTPITFKDDIPYYYCYADTEYIPMQSVREYVKRPDACKKMSAVLDEVIQSYHEKQCDKCTAAAKRGKR
jgi:hypothetical protein